MTIANLTSKQRAELRSRAHHLKPVVQVGGAGVTDAVVATVAEALNTRELIKIRLLESAPEEIRDAADRIAGQVPGSEVVQMIGRVIVLYRPPPPDDSD